MVVAVERLTQLTMKTTTALTLRMGFFFVLTYLAGGLALFTAHNHPLLAIVLLLIASVSAVVGLLKLGALLCEVYR